MVFIVETSFWSFETSSSNPNNIVRATIDALSKIDSPRQVAARRNKKVSEVMSKSENQEEVTDGA